MHALVEFLKDILLPFLQCLCCMSTLDHDVNDQLVQRYFAMVEITLMFKGP